MRRPYLRRSSTPEGARSGVSSVGFLEGAGFMVRSGCGFVVVCWCVLGLVVRYFLLGVCMCLTGLESAR